MLLDGGHVVATGEELDGILRTAKSSSAGLIVMGSHRKLLRDFFVGTTIEQVIRIGSFPVLMVNEEAARPYRQALVAVDMSEPCAHAIKTAKALGLIDDGYVIFVHALMALAKGRLYVANASEDQIDEYVASERRQASGRAFYVLGSA